jgi:hypothetical protein
MYWQLEYCYNRTGAVCCADSAFTAQNSFIIKSSADISNAAGPVQANKMLEVTLL